MFAYTVCSIFEIPVENDTKSYAEFLLIAYGVLKTEVNVAVVVFFFFLCLCMCLCVLCFFCEVLWPSQYVRSSRAVLLPVNTVPGQT